MKTMMLSPLMLAARNSAIKRHIKICKETRPPKEGEENLNVLECTNDIRILLEALLKCETEIVDEIAHLIMFMFSEPELASMFLKMIRKSVAELLRRNLDILTQNLVRTDG